MLERSTEMELAFSLKKQSAFGTAIPDTDLTLAHPVESDEIFTDDLETWSDEGSYGKGHEYPTRRENLTASTGFKMTTKASSLFLGWGLAFACGSVTTVQPDDVGAPNTYEHTFKPMDISDPAIGKDLPVATFVQKLTSFRKTLFRDMTVKSLKLSGQVKQHLALELEFVGSGYSESSTLSMPALASVSFLRTADITFNVGGVDISAKLVSFELMHSNAIDEDAGYRPGSGALPDGAQIRAKLPVESRQTAVKFRVEMNDDTFRDYMRNNTPKSVTITAEGTAIEQEYKHKLEITIPKCFLKASPSKEKNFYVWDIECEVSWDDVSAAPFTAVVTNTTPAYLEAAL